MSLCDKCMRARAFIKGSKVMDAAVKAAKVVVTTCMLCGATIGPSASPTSAEARSPTRAEYAVFAAMWKRLGQLPPVIHMPAKYAAVPATSRSDRRDRGHRRGRLPSALQEGRSCPMPDGHTLEFRHGVSSPSS